MQHVQLIWHIPRSLGTVAGQRFDQRMQRVRHASTPCLPTERLALQFPAPLASIPNSAYASRVSRRCVCVSGSALLVNTHCRYDHTAITFSFCTPLLMRPCNASMGLHTCRLPPPTAAWRRGQLPLSRGGRSCAASTNANGGQRASLGRAGRGADAPMATHLKQRCPKGRTMHRCRA